MKDYTNYRRSELERRVEHGGFGVLYVMVTSVTGAGKSTTLNALSGGMWHRWAAAPTP